MLIGIDANPLLLTRPSGIEVHLAELVRLLPVVAPRHRYRLYFNYIHSRHNERRSSFSSRNVETRTCRIPPQVLAPLHRYAGLPIDWLAGRVDLMYYSSFAVQPQWHGRAVVTVYDLIPLTHPELCGARYARDIATQVRNLRRADAIIAISRNTADSLSEILGVERERVYIVPMGVDERFRHVAASGGPAEAPRRLGIDGPYILFVGNHERRKNLPRLVKAYCAMEPAVRRRHCLVLAGSSKEGDEPAIAAAIAEVPADSRVIQLGYVAAADLPELYYGASAFCYPSLVEGFGIPPLEAMASGCPVLAADIPTLREVLGDAALLVDPLSVDALRDGLERVLEDADLRSVLSERGARRAADFSWERTARETVAVFERIAGGGRQ